MRCSRRFSPTEFEREDGCFDYRWAAAQLLEGAGYETQILEFVDMEHTPKNLLIRGVYTGRKKNLEKTRRCIEELHLNPTLARLLGEQEVDER